MYAEFIQFRKDQSLLIVSAWQSNTECLLPGSESGFADDPFGSAAAIRLGQLPLVANHHSEHFSAGPTARQMQHMRDGTAGRKQ